MTGMLLFYIVQTAILAKVSIFLEGLLLHLTHGAIFLLSFKLNNEVARWSNLYWHDLNSAFNECTSVALNVLKVDTDIQTGTRQYHEPGIRQRKYCHIYRPVFRNNRLHARLLCLTKLWQRSHEIYAAYSASVFFNVFVLYAAKMWHFVLTRSYVLMLRLLFEKDTWR
jgi:hypothetical protein